MNENRSQCPVRVRSLRNPYRYRYRDLTAMNKDEWWEDIFSDKEIEQIEHIAETVETEMAEELDDAWIDLSIMFTASQIQPILSALRTIVNSTWIQSREEPRMFLTLLGEAIAQEYLQSGLPYDEPTADEAQHWYQGDTD